MSEGDSSSFSDSFRDLDPTPKSGEFSAEHVAAGVPIPKTKRIELLSPDDWEAFTEEWASSLESDYSEVRRFGGAGDKGLDVAAFTSTAGFSGEWDSFQCKRYDHALRPSDIWLEIGKVIFYTYRKDYTVPRKHFFIGSKGIGTSLTRLLLAPDELKEKCREAWPEKCEGEITVDDDAKLEKSLLEYFNSFDFSIFGSKSLADLIKGHSKTPFHSVRFGGGLPFRPSPDSPPKQPRTEESRYIEQIFEAYTDHTGEAVEESSDLAGKPELEDDFLRQRVRFYHAESLRNFARDTVPEGTFEDLQEQVFQGVVDIAADTNGDGLHRMRSTLSQAASTSISSSALSTVTKTQDKQGICHQLANEDKLIWVKSNSSPENTK